MILVTGGTGFIGQMVVRQLKAADQVVRLLLRPSKTTPNIPQGLAVDAAISSLIDERGMKAALKGVDTVVHLAGAERLSNQADLSNVDVLGTQILVKAATEAGIRRLVFLSHLGANQSSAFPVLRAKGLAEIAITRSRLNFTVLRSAAGCRRGPRARAGRRRPAARAGRPWHWARRRRSAPSRCRCPPGRPAACRHQDALYK